MGAFDHTFTSPRGTDVDPLSLTQQLQALDASAGVGHIPNTGNFLITKATAWTGPQITAAQNVLDTAPVASAQLTAQASIDAMSIFDKAIVLALIDQLNVIRAALPVPLGAITPAQALQKIRDKAALL